MKNLMSLIIPVLISLGNNNCEAQKKTPEDFLPQGYVIFETIKGDLNKDGLEDCVMIIKGTDKEAVVINRFDKEVDRNRRGIIVLFNKNGNYELVLKNENCFYSENEDGGVYYPPQLSIEIKNGNLYLNYEHGRYGYWSYMFRFQNTDFELIGYDSTSTYGPIINRALSINFLTKKKLLRENTNEDAESGEEVFNEVWKEIEIAELLKLSKIEDFGELDMNFDE